jgi:hypothetical protein
MFHPIFAVLPLLRLKVTIYHIAAVHRNYRTHVNLWLSLKLTTLFCWNRLGQILLTDCAQICSDFDADLVIIETWLICQIASLQKLKQYTKISMIKQQLSLSILEITEKTSELFNLAHWNKSAGRQVSPLGHIILIPSQPVFALTP